MMPLDSTRPVTLFFVAVIAVFSNVAALRSFGQARAILRGRPAQGDSP
jgi:hypothetical protein